MEEIPRIAVCPHLARFILKFEGKSLQCMCEEYDGVWCNETWALKVGDIQRMERA